MRGGVATRAPFPVLVACAAGIVADIATADHAMAQPAACYRDSAGALRIGTSPNMSATSRRQAHPSGVGSPLPVAVLAMTIRPSVASSGGGTTSGNGASGKRRGGVGDRRRREAGSGTHTPASTARMGTMAGRGAPRHVTVGGGHGRRCWALTATRERRAGGGGIAGDCRSRQEHKTIPGSSPAAASTGRSWGAGRAASVDPRPRRNASMVSAIAGDGLKCPECFRQPIVRAAARPCAQFLHTRPRRPRPGPRPTPLASSFPMRLAPSSDTGVWVAPPT